MWGRRMGCGVVWCDEARADALESQDAHLQTVVEVLQSIKASEMTPMLQRIYQGDGGSELLDVLMKYLWVAPFWHCRFLHVSSA